MTGYAGPTATQHATRLIDSLEMRWDGTTRAAVVSRNPDLLRRELAVDLDHPGRWSPTPAAATPSRQHAHQQDRHQQAAPPVVFMVPAGRATGGRGARVTPLADARPLAPVVCVERGDREAGRRFAPTYYAAATERPGQGFVPQFSVPDDARRHVFPPESAASAAPAASSGSAPATSHRTAADQFTEAASSTPWAARPRAEQPTFDPRGPPQASQEKPQRRPQRQEAAAARDGNPIDDFVAAGHFRLTRLHGS